MFYCSLDTSRKVIQASFVKCDESKIQISEEEMGEVPSFRTLIDYVSQGVYISEMSRHIRSRISEQLENLDQFNTESFMLYH